MDYLSDKFIYTSQPEIILQDVINIDNDKKEKNFLTDEQIQNLLENYENKSNKNLLFIILFILFFLFIFCFITF